MGTTGSSSKRKSSSLRKKRSKNSSQVQKRKIIHSKSRRDKSRKLRRRDDSVSYSDDDSRSSVSISSSSSKDEYRRVQSRSRTRRDVRVGKKKARRNSSSHESIQDSPRVKKRKRSKRNANLNTKKKTHKKKRKRDASISSMSSGSQSCSTCRDGSSSSGESEYEKPRGRRERKEREKRGIGKGKSGAKRSRYRSRSYSPCSRCSKGSGYQSEEKLIDGNSSRRLRSIITIAREPEENEERELNEDGHKEEFVYDHDDYPSSRSNDSNDGESRRELAHHLHTTSEKKGRPENVKGQEAYISDIQTTEVTESGNDGGGRYDGRNPSFDGIEANNCLMENKSEVSPAIGSATSDLESILRQRALENLRKFRGGIHKNARIPPDQQGKSDNDMKQSSTTKAESSQVKSHRDDGARVVSATRVVDQICLPPISRNSFCSLQSDGKVPDGEYGKTESGAGKSIQIMSQTQDGARVVRATHVGDQISVPTIGRNSISSRNDGKILERKYSGTESGSAKQDGICPPNRLATASDPKEKDSSSVRVIIHKSEPGTSALRREPSGSCSILKQVPTSQVSPKGRLLATKSSVDTSVAETAQTVARSGNDNSEKVSDACGSAAPELPACATSSSGEQNSKDPQTEAKEGSQFEQKTMSVMRGGELVQVSYKVYIPKKAPALARRQLQR